MTDPITRRLALAALRLSIFALGFSGSRTLAMSDHFARLAAWVGAKVGMTNEEAVERAMRETVAALVEAGAVKP